MTTTSGLKLKAYWQSRCDGSSAPLRSDLDPMEMKSFLPDLMIAEMAGVDGFRIRLAGTRVARRLGTDPTSRSISPDLGGAVGGLASLITECAREGHPVDGRIEYPDGVESFDAIDCIVLPLRKEGDTADQFILALDFVFAATSLAPTGSSRLGR